MPKVAFYWTMKMKAHYYIMFPRDKLSALDILQLIKLAYYQRTKTPLKAL